MQNLDDAVERMWTIGRALMVQDFRRIEKRKREQKTILAAPVGKENGTAARGMICAFLKANEYQRYLLYPTEVKLLDEFLPIFDSLFPHEFSRHLDQDCDRARIISCADDYRLTMDSVLVNYALPAKRRLRKLIGDSFREFPGLKALHREGDFQFPEKEKVYSTLLGDTYSGHESTRIAVGLHCALAFQRPVLVIKQSVPAQEGMDIDIEQADPISEEKDIVKYSRLGTGQMLLFGPSGLERSGFLRIRTDSKEGERIGYVEREVDGEELPVVFEESTYKFTPRKRADERHVQKTETMLIPEKELRLYELKR